MTTYLQNQFLTQTRIQYVPFAARTRQNIIDTYGLASVREHQNTKREPEDDLQQTHQRQNERIAQLQKHLTTLKNAQNRELLELIGQLRTQDATRIEALASSEMADSLCEASAVYTCCDELATQILKCRMSMMIQRLKNERMEAILSGRQ